VYVSQLRKALGRERIVTRPPGYELRLEPGELDLARFEELVAEGRLSDALRLWRGHPLADFAYEPFAQAEIARFESRHTRRGERCSRRSWASSRAPS
jgi:DNA-binding SARP family transcriptional activator